MESNQQNRMPVIGLETASHFLGQIHAKMVDDAQKLTVAFKAIEELMELGDEKVLKILDKHGIKKNGTS